MFHQPKLSEIFIDSKEFKNRAKNCNSKILRYEWYHRCNHTVNIDSSDTIIDLNNIIIDISNTIVGKAKKYKQCLLIDLSGLWRYYH